MVREEGLTALEGTRLWRRGEDDGDGERRLGG